MDTIPRKPSTVMGKKKTENETSVGSPCNGRQKKHHSETIGGLNFAGDLIMQISYRQQSYRI